MDFNAKIDRTRGHVGKWERMEDSFGIPLAEGIAMCTAVSEYPTAPCIRDALRDAADHGLFGYSWEYTGYRNAIAWWMKTRHGWEIDPGWIVTTQGLGNALALSIHAFSGPDDGVAFFTPVYHEFSMKVARAGRTATQLPLKRVGDRYDLDLDDAQSRLTGNERVLLWCSPQNPGGRVWSPEELRAVSDFAARNGMVLVSDEVHHDIVYPGATFTPMDVAVPDGRDRTVYLTAASKTFNIAGMRTGQMIIPDAGLRKAIRDLQRSVDYKPSSLGVVMTEAAYSPEGAAWADAQIAHLDAMRKIFADGMNAIPGAHAMPMQATYLGWVDFSGTGMAQEEIATRIREDARITCNQGPKFGAGGAGFVRFNFAMPEALLREAVGRLQRAFADLQ